MAPNRLVARYRVSWKGETFCFRLGLEFEYFKSGGLVILQDALSRHRPLLLPQSYDQVPSVFEDMQFARG